MANSQEPSVLMGAGGMRPSVWALCPDGEGPEKLCDLPPGHSVYALDSDFERRAAVVGTRPGRVAMVSWGPAPGAGDARMSHNLDARAPVLAVCWASPSEIICADLTGKCVRWRPFGAESAGEAVLEGRVVCSLLALPGNRVVALCTDGALMSLKGKDTRFRGMAQRLPPARKWALVNLLHWPACESVVYPAIGGQLAAFGLADQSSNHWAAHEGEFSATFLHDGLLWTVGRDDGLMKAWPDIGGDPSHVLKAPAGIVCGASLYGSPGQVVLAATDGKAGVYAIEGDQLRLVRPIEGGPFRALAGPPSHLLDAWERKRREARARELVAEIEERVSARRTNGLEPLYAELEGIGYTAAGLSCRAWQAEQDGNPIEALRLRHQLMASLACNEPLADKPKLRYAQSLVAAWRLEKALEAYRGVPGGVNGGGAPQWLTAACEALKSDDWVVEPDMPIEGLIEAANIAGQPFTGRWVACVGEPAAFPSPNLEANAVVAEYEEVKAEEGLTGLPTARAETPWWLSRGAVEKADVLGFDGPAGTSGSSQQFVLRLQSRRHSVTICPFILFKVETPRKGGNWQDHNAAALAACRSLRQQGWRLPWLEKADAAVIVALRRLASLASIGQLV